MNDTFPYKPPDGLHPKLLKFRQIALALRFPTRWHIIEFIGKDSRSTGDIYKDLLKNGEELSKSGLYYHLSALKKASIIEVATYLEEGGGASVKVWKLRTGKIIFDLLKGEFE